MTTDPNVSETNELRPHPLNHHRAYSSRAMKRLLESGDKMGHPGSSIMSPLNGAFRYSPDQACRGGYLLCEKMRKKNLGNRLSSPVRTLLYHSMD
ncbi:hypothetical protein J6590_007075 [Homalodisca vitripennis]|nr:hypothetical protein J6590_007075 [Homalodisca vitripennis]